MIGLSLCLLLAAGSVILYQKNKLLKLKNTAIDIFYTMKSLELQIAQLEELVLLKADKTHIKELLTKREKLKEMERSYNHFVKDLGLYKKMPEEERSSFKLLVSLGNAKSMFHQVL